MPNSTPQTANTPSSTATSATPPADPGPETRVDPVLNSFQGLCDRIAKSALTPSDLELLGLKLSPPARATPPRSGIVVKMNVNLLEKYGNSAGRVLMFALDVQRTTYFNQMISEIHEGEFGNAYSTHHDYTMTVEMLNELTMCAIDLANQNLDAASYLSDPKQYATSVERTEEQESDSYRRFLKEFCNQDSESAK